jgi:hypothetical protein
MFAGCLQLFALLAFTLRSAEGAADCGKIYNESGCGGSGAVVFNVTDQAECCTKCGGYSCATWTFGATSDSLHEGFPPHNCAIMSTFIAPRKVAGHVCGVVGSVPAPTPPQPHGPACNADISCDVLGTSGWRCLHDAAVTGPAALCHLAGPGSKGNSTCSCATPGCAKTNVVPTAGKSQYLMIGDSVSLGMHSLVFANLSKHEVQSTHSPGNAASANEGAHCIADWVEVAGVAWDTISFQFGLQ